MQIIEGNGDAIYILFIEVNKIKSKEQNQEKQDNFQSVGHSALGCMIYVINEKVSRQFLEFYPKELLLRSCY